MAVKIIHGCDFSPWVRERLGKNTPEFGPCTSIGFGDETKLLGAVVFFRYVAGSMYLAMASDSPRIVSRRTIRAVFDYAFKQCKCNRLTVHALAGNGRSIRFIEGLGWKREGVMRKAWNGEDMIVFGLLREEAQRWM